MINILFLTGNCYAGGMNVEGSEYSSNCLDTNIATCLLPFYADSILTSVQPMLDVVLSVLT